MEWKTAITKIQDDKEYIRGYALSDLMTQKSFTEVVFLVLKGELPNKQETAMLNALLVAVIDHGTGIASTMAARLSASAGNSVHTALAAGILSFGQKHALAAEAAAQFFSEQIRANATPLKERLLNLKSQKIRVPGFGHGLLLHDHRVDVLMAIAKENKIYGTHCVFAEEVGSILNEISSKKLPMNVDGAIAAIMLDMGFDWRLAQGLFIIGRVPGLIAHIFEEVTMGGGLRRLSENEEEYVGVRERKVD